MIKRSVQAFKPNWRWRMKFFNLSENLYPVNFEIFYFHLSQLRKSQILKAHCTFEVSREGEGMFVPSLFCEDAARINHMFEEAFSCVFLFDCSTPQINDMWVFLKHVSFVIIDAIDHFSSDDVSRKHNIIFYKDLLLVLRLLKIIVFWDCNSNNLTIPFQINNDHTGANFDALIDVNTPKLVLVFKGFDFFLRLKSIDSLGYWLFITELFGH